ncbi:MAG TPA: HAD family hydrolase [Phycisphaerae bacterium]|nr:HAD family hydrolase [Phycisphaerae bacterium]
MELDGIFLDLYGTITAGDRDAVEAVCEDVVRDTGIGVSAHDLSITWGERFFHFLDFCNEERFKTLFEVEQQTLRETMAMLGVAIDPDPYCRKLQCYWQDAPLQDDVKAFFDAVKYPICIVSNADDADAHAVIRRHALPVDHVVTSETARSYKPHPRIFETALALTGWRRDRVLHAGDSLHSDVGGAIVTGLRSAWINRARRIHDIGTHTADVEFAGLSGLATWRSKTEPRP